MASTSGSVRSIAVTRCPRKDSSSSAEDDASSAPSAAALEHPVASAVSTSNIDGIRVVGICTTICHIGAIGARRGGPKGLSRREDAQLEELRQTVRSQVRDLLGDDASLLVRIVDDAISVRQAKDVGPHEVLD